MNSPERKIKNYSVYIITALSRFENKVLIWEGNFSKTYLTYDRNLSRNVILKEFPKENKELAQREYSFLSKIRYKTPEVYDMFGNDEYIYIVREYIPGKTLREVLEERGKLPLQFALFIAWEVLRFLDFIDAKGEFNGDITPSNIIIGFDGQVKILDCSKSQDILTPAYYDQKSKKDIVSDLKALGKVLENICDHKVIRELSIKAQSGYYSKPRYFISDVLKKIGEFGVFFEREAEIIVSGGSYPVISERRRFKKVLLIIPLALVSFWLGLFFSNFSKEKITNFERKSENTESKSETSSEQSVFQGTWTQQTEAIKDVTEQQVSVKEKVKSNIKSSDVPKRKGFGYIFINSLPESEIYIDGKIVDRTPVVNLRVQEGYHLIEFRNQLTSHTTKIEVQNNQKVFVFADLTNMRIEIKKEISD